MYCTQYQHDRTVTVIDVNAEQEVDAREALHHPTTNCLCLTNVELSSHSLLQLVEHREKPLQNDGESLYNNTQYNISVVHYRVFTDIMC